MKIYTAPLLRQGPPELSRLWLIHALIPLRLQVIGAALDAEVTALADTRYCRTSGQAGVVRWGQQRGSVYLADQKLPIPVPRVRKRCYFPPNFTTALHQSRARGGTTHFHRT
jgi:hypothetical protein